MAAVRPAFKSMLPIFLERRHFDYGIPALDRLVQTREMTSSFIIFQEQIMKILQSAGFTAPDSYAAIKAISKKKAEKVLKLKEQFTEGFTRLTGDPAATEKVWTIINDATSYLFNASHAVCVALDSLYGTYLKAHYPLEFYTALGECSGALAANAGMKQQSYLAYALQGNGIDRADTAGCNGCGWKANVSYTLNTIDRHAVCYQDTVGALCAADWRGPSSQYVGADKLICTDARGNGTGQVCANVTGDHENRVTDYTNIITYGGDKAGTLDASYYKGAGARNGKEREFVAERKAGHKYIVRRLSTTECARLQGLPDCWAIPVHKEDMTDEEAVFWEKVRETHAAINGTRYKPFSKREQLVRWYNRLHTDSAEYKLYGNGIALPCAVYILRGIAQVIREKEGEEPT